MSKLSTRETRSLDPLVFFGTARGQYIPVPGASWKVYHLMIRSEAAVIVICGDAVYRLSYFEACRRGFIQKQIHHP